MTIEEIQAELQKRNLTLDHIMEYIKFEDECVSKGFSFNGLIKAREKQIAEKPLDVDYRSDCDYVAWLCPACGRTHINGYELNYCSECGQRLDWGV